MNQPPHPPQPPPSSSPPPHRPPRPRETLDRCALHAQLRGDPLMGTAFPASRLLLVEQPGPWGRDGLRDSRFDRQVAAALHRRAAAAGLRTQAIRRPGRTPLGTSRQWLVVDARAGTNSVRGGTYTDDGELLDLPLDGSAGAPQSGPLYLACAHSKHDACCALRGRSVAAALAELRPTQVWETTHLGGDRFAANVLVLPAGLLYGRVLPFAAAEFIAAAEADEVVGALLRGHIGYPPAAQAALAYAHEHLALRRRTDLSVVGVARAEDGIVAVRLRGPHGEMLVRLRVERVRADRLTCHDTQAGYYLAYRPLVIEPVIEPIPEPPPEGQLG